MTCQSGHSCVGYADHGIKKIIASKLKDFATLTSHLVKKCPVHLHVPWLGNFRLDMKVKLNRG